MKCRGKKQGMKNERLMYILAFLRERLARPAAFASALIN